MLLTEVALDDVIEGWTEEERANLCALLKPQENTSEAIKHRLKWLYHSRVRAGTESAVKNIGSWIGSKISDHERAGTSMDATRDMPSYTTLLVEACKSMSVFEKNASREELELFLCHAVIVQSLTRMQPRQRLEFMRTEIPFDQIAKQANMKGPRLTGSLTTFAALGTAQASGFGVYMAATTALGFLTHAAGITLPFAIYTGMSSTIAFAIGPAGWLAASAWLTFKLTGPEWKTLVPALVCIIATNSAKQG